MTETANIPKLRFPEFEGEWEKYKIKNSYDLISGQHLNPDEYTITETNNNPYFTGPSDFTNESSEIKKWSLKKGKIAKKNDILFTVKGNGVGTLMFLKLEQVTMGRQLMAIRSVKDSTILLYHFLQTKKQYFEALASGNMIPGLSRDDILETKICFPTLPEQQKIAAFLTAVDDKIQQLTKKKALLEQYKKGVMQRIFSPNYDLNDKQEDYDFKNKNHSNPENQQKSKFRTLRFKDDNGKEFPAWEEKKLGEIAEIKKGEQLNKDEFESFGIYPALNGGIEPSGFTTKWNTEENTITISEGGNSCGYINFMKTKFWSGGHCYSIFIKNSQLVDKKFLYQLLKQNEVEIMKLRVGSGLPNIQKKDIIRFHIKIPKAFAEQQKIASFLTALDNKIEQVNTQLDKTKALKKGLLQQLFV